MQRILLELRGATAFVRRNFHLTKRYWKWELVWFVYTMANAVTMGFIGRGFQMFGATVNTEYIVTYMLLIITNADSTGIQTGTINDFLAVAYQIPRQFNTQNT